MTNLKDTAKSYEPALTHNIVDLEVVSTELNVMYDTGIDKDGKEFTYSYIEADGKQYRVPVSVIAQLKVILEDSPKLQKFRVKKTGEGMQTRYTVIPLI